VSARYRSWLAVIRIPEYVTGTGAVGVAGLLDAAVGGAEVAVRVGVGGPEGLGGRADLDGFGFFEARGDGEPDADGEALAAVADCDVATFCARLSFLSPSPGTSSSAAAAPPATSTTAAADSTQPRALRPLASVPTEEVCAAAGSCDCGQGGGAYGPGAAPGPITKGPGSAAWGGAVGE
jgi:hypothetical protein